MTEGKPSSVLWRYSLPLLVSVAFQQFYNMADSMIAGNFIKNGENALAAIGASYPITMLFMAFAVGCNSGCSVVVSNLFGGRRYGRLKTAVFTSLVSIGVLSVILTLIGALFSADLLRLLGTPENVFGDARAYLDIYVYGVPFLMFYNVCNGVFAALGDSKTPLYFLIGSSVGNILLDLGAVVGLNMGVPGVAWATFIAQGAAAVLALFALLRRLKRLGIADGEGEREPAGEAARLFSLEMLGKIAVIAIPSILQQSFVSVGNLFIQRIVNDYGSAAMAGYSTAIKLNTFVITSVSAMSNGMSAFTAQNAGAGKLDRIVRGFKTSLAMSAMIALPITALYLGLREPLIRAFMRDGEDAAAILVGCRFLAIVAPFYFAVTAKLNCDAVLKGAGAVGCFVVTTFTDLILRVILAYVFSGPLGLGLDGVWWSWPVGWGVSAAVSVAFYALGRWKRHIRGV
ncbi:MAG: MATE family efflux transporter [Bacteroides sp.]|nr:MATE family efflux transporter [Bacteroides sp.]